MDSATNITINIVEPGSDVPVPDTGLFTHGIGGVEASIIATVGIVIVIAIAAIILYLRKKKINLKPSKHTSIILSILAIITSIATFTGLTFNSVYNHTNAKEGDLTVAAEDANLTIEVGDQPVFAVLPVDVTVEEATLAGYTLTASTNSTDLVSTTDSSKVIPMVAADEGELVALADNTYGLVLEEKPTTKDEAVYTALSTDLSNPTILKAIDDYSSTPANDITTIYYGFYITPDVPYGTYKGSTISYEAIPNLATISYNANGLYYNNDESFTTNTVGYKPSTPDSPIEELSGEYLTPAPLNPNSSSSPIHYTFLGWSKTEGATTPDYEDEEDIIANLTLSPNEDITLYAVWHYDTILSFNGNTSDGGEPIADITIPAGTTITLPQNTYTRTGSVFTSWNTVAIPTEQDPGESYEDEADFTAPDSSADITLYAQWAYYSTITFNGNGADSGTMSPQDIVAGTPENLVPNAFTKANATFIGWNTVQNPTPDNPGTTYQDQAEFIASSTQHEDITLYAQWAATTISFNGNTSESGTMNPITIPGGEQVTLPQNAYTKSHCTFISWNTNSDGTGTRYPGEASYTASMDGIYSFTLYAQWQCESMINFSGNGETSGYMPGIMATGGQQTTLPQNTFTRDGYSFNGWNTKADGTGESYPDQGTYIAPVSESQNVTLYAQWKQVFYMQDVATWGSTLTQGNTMKAVDKRDGQEYTVARLADNKIWMTKNLNLAGGTEITSELSNVPDGYTLPTANGFQSGNKLPASSTSGFNNDTKAFVYNSTKTSGTDCGRPGCYSYYSWTAATAGSGLSITADNSDAPYSICPKGWKLPSIRTTSVADWKTKSDFYQLAVAYGMDPSSTSQSTAKFYNQAGPGTTPNFLLTGYYYNGSFYGRGSGGHYWSSTSGNSTIANYLYFYSSGVYSATNHDRRYGSAVRCIAE